MTDAMYYAGALNLGAIHQRTPLGTLTLAHSGETDIVIDLSTLVGTGGDGGSSQTFWHWFDTSDVLTRGLDLDGSERFPYYSRQSLGKALATAVNAATTTGGHSWPTSDFHALWLESQAGSAVPFYKFTYGSAFTYQFSTLAGSELFGLATTSVSSSANAHFLGTPRGVVFPALQAISVDNELEGIIYEPRGVASSVVTDDGRVIGNSRYQASRYRDFWQQYNRKSDMNRADARAASKWWSFEELFGELRSEYAFYIAHPQFGDAYEYPVFSLRDDGNTWVPKRASVGNNAQLHVAFRCYALGSLEVVTP